VDGLWHRRLRAKSAFTFPEQATRFPPESYKPVQNLLSRMKSMRPLAVGRDATCRPNGAYFRGLPRLAKINPDATTSRQPTCRPGIGDSGGSA
jgi:hypothetical protein